MAQNWRIVGQQQTDRLDSTRGFVPAMEVTFRTIPEDIEGKVTVDQNQYSADYVRSLIDERVATIQEVNKL